jgi:imidazolonepropionase-like amidohydrolase
MTTTARDQRPSRTDSKPPVSRQQIPTMKLVALLALATLTAPTFAQEVVAVRAGRLIPIVGEEIKDAVVLIQDGRITAIGAGIEVPWNAKVIDASDKVVMPTWVLADQTGGLYGGNFENMANVPYLSVADAIDPTNIFFEEALRNGVGSIHVLPQLATLLGGRGMVVQPYGKTVADMTVLSHSALRLSLQGQGGSRVAQIQKLRRSLEDVQDWLKDYERRKKEFEAEKAAGAVPADKTFDEEIDTNRKPVVDLLQGKGRAFLYVPTAAELPEALRMLTRYTFPITLTLGPRCVKAVDALAALKQPVVLTGAVEFTEVDPDTDEETTTCLAVELAKRNIRFAMTLDDDQGAGRYPWWQLATAIRNGLDRKIAIESMTIVAAEVLGLQKDFGSLEVGKIANLQILTGDPLQAATWVDKVLLEGQLVYERDLDPRLEHLFGRKPEAATSGSGN